MKKKFGDLTIKEIYEACENQDKCALCPMYRVCPPRRFDFPAEWKEDLDVEVKL